VHWPVWESCSHESDGSRHAPAQLPAPSGPQNAGCVVEEVEVDVDVDVVVVLQVPSPQASQQLGADPMHALPPGGAVQRAGSRFTAHAIVPELRVRQHVKESGRPHVERDAHLRTTCAQAWFTSVACAVAAVQRRYVPRSPLQSHAAATAARAFATSVLSGSMLGSHPAHPIRAVTSSATSRATARTLTCMGCSLRVRLWPV
jgi:hypothetical protein